MFDKGSLYFSGRETMTRDVYDVVYSASDPVVSIVISACAVSSELFPESVLRKHSLALCVVFTHIESWIDVEVGIHISLMSAPYCARHAWPWLFERQHALHIVTRQFLS